mmetsp:Transcript_18576/g.74650  ORF Transcript_18576/g.74650 Transcript_18576/m.74650 type:complete len:339 (-) Transcript_18576:82-1098(-)
MRGLCGFVMLSLLGSVLCDNVVTVSDGKLLVYDSTDFSWTSQPIQTISDPEGGSFARMHRYKDYIYTTTGYAYVRRWGISGNGKLYQTDDVFWFQYCPTGLNIRGSSDPENADYIMLICPYYSYGNSRVILANPKTLEFEHTVTSTNSGTHAGIIGDAVLTGDYLYASELVPHDFGYGMLLQFDVNNNFKKTREAHLAAPPVLSIHNKSDLFATITNSQQYPAVNDILRLDADTLESLATESTTCTDLVRLSPDSKTLFVACDNSTSLKVYDVSGSGLEFVCESVMGSGAYAGMGEVDGFLFGAGPALSKYTLADNGCPVSVEVLGIACNDIGGLSKE